MPMKIAVQSAALLLLLAALSFGCKKAPNVGVQLNASVDDTIAVPSPVTDTGSGYTNAYLTPSEFGIAFYKAGLMTATDTTPSFSIFEKDPADSTTVVLGTTPAFIGLSSFIPQAGTYTKVAFGISYFEFVVPTASSTERFRVYLSSIASPAAGSGLPGAVQARDVLIENPFASGGYAWIDTADATFKTTRPAAPLQINPTQLLSGSGDPFVGTATLSPSLTLTSDQEGIFVVNLVAAIKNLFFFDDVNDNGSFDYPPQFPCGAGQDGCLSTVTPPANFAPAYPGVTATVSTATPTAAAPTPTPTP